MNFLVENASRERGMRSAGKSSCALFRSRNLVEIRQGWGSGELKHGNVEKSMKVHALVGTINALEFFDILCLDTVVKQVSF